jgi:hypothetical protein
MNTEQATIEQQNAAIAEFIGGVRERHPTWTMFPNDYGYRFPTGEWRNERNLDYHISWDRLIPVVEKIATLCPNDVVHMEFGKTYTRCNLWNLDNGRTHVFDESKDTPILTVYQAVYQFIQWYNKQQQ